MKLRAMILPVLLGCCGAHAQEPGAVQGRVVDGATGEPLAGATVAVVGASRGSVTGTGGEFVIRELAPGVIRLRASFVGFSAETLTTVVAPGQPAQVSFRLRPAVIQTLPIIVSATRSRSRETPVTSSTLDRAALEERHPTQDIPVLLTELPSVTSYSEAGNGMGYTYLNIRGFDARRVAVMVNGIPQNDPEDHNVYWLDFPDIAESLEDIQVQRGAGSAFYGPPAIGGSVNLITKNFASERRFQASAGLGSYNTRRYALSLSSGVFAGRYALHARLSKLLSSGYRDRSWVDFNGYFVGVMRFDEDMTTQFNAYGGPVSDHLAYYGIPKADVADRSARRANPILREEEIENFSQPHYELFHEWRLSPSVTLNNTLFLVLGEGSFDYDGSWAPYSYYRIAPEYGFPEVTGDPDTLFFPNALIRAMVDNTQYGWLPRVTIRHDGGEIVAGAELRIHRSIHWGRLERADLVPVSVPEDYRYFEYRGAKDIVSVYAHALQNLREDLTLMLNLQYAFNSYRLYDESFVGTDFTVPYHFINPRAGINLNLSDRWNTYASAGYTSREPRLKNLYDAAEASTPAAWGAVVPQFEPDASGQPDFTRPLVTPERLFNLELGAAYADTALSAATTLYWMEFTDEIIRSGQVDRFGQPVTGNADRTRHVGIELSGRVRIGGGVEASGHVTVSRNRFVRHTDYSTGSPLILDASPIAGFPDLLGAIRLTWRTGPLAITAAGRYQGKQYTDNFGNELNTVDPSFVVNAGAQYHLPMPPGGPGVELQLQVNNVFDALYAAYGEGDQFFVGAERNVFSSLTLTF
jgi:iron complex outermembrane receptor protein